MDGRDGRLRDHRPGLQPGVRVRPVADGPAAGTDPGGGIRPDGRRPGGGSGRGRGLAAKDHPTPPRHGQQGAFSRELTLARRAARLAWAIAAA
ncbi:MAG: hypothetical protein E6I22_06215 [Chloroflexi bacterium]|nr:MAG: hypothetical protein E6I22_06215 [Chloroflexota bacterium]